MKPIKYRETELDSLRPLKDCVTAFWCKRIQMRCVGNGQGFNFRNLMFKAWCIKWHEKLDFFFFLDNEKGAYMFTVVEELRSLVLTTSTLSLLILKMHASSCFQSFFCRRSLSPLKHLNNQKMLSIMLPVNQANSNSCTAALKSKHNFMIQIHLININPGK